MAPVATTIDRTVEALRELGGDLEAARHRRDRWFGRYSMHPLSVSDAEVQELRLAGLVEVLDWHDGPRDGGLLHVPDPESRQGVRAVRTRSQPAYVRLSTDGWALLDR